MRQLVRELTEARNWAEGINDCVSRIERWSRGDHISTVKVDARVVEKLLNESLSRCNEPGYKILKVKYCCWKLCACHFILV